MERRSLPGCARRPKSQMQGTAMELVKSDFFRRVMVTFHIRIANPTYLINIDETTVYLNCSPTRTVHPKGEKTVYIMLGNAPSM